MRSKQSMTSRSLIVITGSSGVGKSTLAAAFQEQMLPQVWLHFSVDSIFYCLPHSLVERVDHKGDLDVVDSKALVEGAYACAKALLDQGHRVVFDAVILSRKGAAQLNSAFAAYEPLLVEVVCNWQEIERRTRKRGDRTVEEAEHGYRNARGHVAANLVLDSTAAGPERLASKVALALRGEA